MARQSRLGPKIGFESDDALADANREAIALLEPDAGHSRNGGHADRDQRLHRTARRRLRSGQHHVSWRGGELPRLADWRDGRDTADLVSGLTMTNANEAIGMTKAAASAGMPAVMSFTVETDGRLPTGQSLADAIAEVITRRATTLLTT